MTDMEQPDIAQDVPSHVTSPSLAERARSFDHPALAELFDRSFDDAYEFAHGLTGDDATAERAATAAYARVVEHLPEYEGDAHGLVPWVMAQVEEAVRRTPHSTPEDVRGEIGRLGHGEHQVVTLRLVAGLEPTAIAAGTGRRVTSVLASEMAGVRRLAGLPGASVALPTAQRQLDAALDRLLHGEPAAEATGAAPALPVAPRLLPGAERVVQLPRLGAPANVRGRVRAQFLGAADARRAAWVHRHHAPAAVPGRRPRRRAHPIGTAAALLLACALALAAGIVLAGAAAFSSPSSAVYPLKRLGESILLGVTTDRVAKANLEIKLSEERTKEAETEAALGHGDAAVRALRDRYSELTAAASDLSAIRQRDASWKSARDRYQSEASKPVDSLERSLQTQKQVSAANEVKALYQSFESSRQRLDKSLGLQGPAPTNGAQQAPPGLPGSIPTPGAVTGSNR